MTIITTLTLVIVAGAAVAVLVRMVTARWIVHAAVMLDEGNTVNYVRFDETYSTRREAYVQFEKWLADLDGDPYVIALNVYAL